MSCEICREALLIDDVEPPCFSDTCWVPPPDELGQRIIEIRDKLVALHDLVDPGTILSMYDASMQDIEMLAFMEEELKKLKDDQKSNG